MQFQPQGPAYITPTVQSQGPAYITPTVQPQYLQPMQAMQPVTNQNSINNTVVVSQGGGAGSHLLAIPLDRLQSRGWSSGLFSCLNDLFGCGLAVICPAIMMCRLANRMDECAFLMYCVPGGAMALRTKLRTMGGIKGSICGDCMMTCCCCLCCTMCQMSRELDKMGL